MRLFEITEPKFYLCGSAKLIVGEPLAVDHPRYPLGVALEGGLESARPDEALPRDKSLYLSTAPDPHARYVYEVEPIGKVARNHTSWLALLKQTNLHDKSIINQHATCYWSGKERPEARKEPWEYRTLRAYVLKRVLR